MSGTNNTIPAAAHQCLPAQRLKAYLMGQLPPAEIEQVAVQTEACEACQQTMAQIEADDDQLLDIVRDGQNSADWQDSPDLADLLAAAELAHAESRSQADDGTHEDSPAPSEHPAQVGPYRLQSPLGYGGMGTVWRAEHVELRRVVALKMLCEHRLQSESAKARFRREMQAIGRLQHANIVQALDAGEADDRLFLAMEYLPGVDAASEVRRQGPLPVSAACNIVRQACMGIEYAHGQGLLHRDVKPSNLMLLPDATVKVLDLGLARFSQPDEREEDGLTSESHVLGTGDYVAPEQGLDPRAADERSDIYGLGATLFFLLTGQAPFADEQRDTFAKKVMAHVHDPIPSATQQRSEVTPALDALLRRAMAKLPDQRFASAAEMATALAPFCDENIVTATVVGESEDTNIQRAAMPAQPRTFAPWLAAIVTALAMLVLFTLLLTVYPGWMFAKQSSSQRAERYDGQPPAAPVYDGGPPRARNVRPAGEETPPDEASANPNSVAENNKQPATSAEAKPVHLDWIFTEHEGQKRDPSGILIQGQGFCFLSGVQGKFHGWADKVHVDVNKDNVWGVSGAGVEFNVDVKARAYSVETREPRPLSIGVNAYRWSPPSDGVRMLHKDEGLCVLTSFIGGLKADDHFVAVELADDGYYWLRGKSNDTTSTALATSVLLSRERTLNSQVTTYRWPSEMHRQPIRMIHSDEGICFLSGIYGPYSKPEDAARVYIDSDDGYWYLSGSSAEESLIAAQAIAVRFTGEIVD